MSAPGPRFGAAHRQPRVHDCFDRVSTTMKKLFILAIAVAALVGAGAAASLTTSGLAFAEASASH